MMRCEVQSTKYLSLKLPSNASLLVFRRHLALVSQFVRIAFDGNGIHLAKPAAEIDLAAALGAEGHRRAGGRIELLFADGAADH
jgi:hypothetical protein